MNLFIRFVELSSPPRRNFVPSLALLLPRSTKCLISGDATNRSKQHSSPTSTRERAAVCSAARATFLRTTWGCASSSCRNGLQNTKSKVVQLHEQRLREHLASKQKKTPAVSNDKRCCTSMSYVTSRNNDDNNNGGEGLVDIGVGNVFVCF